MCYNKPMEMISGMEVWEIVVMMALAAVLLLFGYRVKKAAFFIIWFLLGYNLMAFLMPEICRVWDVVAESEIYQTLIPIAGGAVLAMFGFTIEKICVSGITFILTMLITIQYFGADMQSLAIGGVVGVILSGVAVMMMKPAILVATSAAGAYALTISIIALASDINFETVYWPMIIGFTVFGSVFQFITTKRIK